MTRLAGARRRALATAACLAGLSIAASGCAGKNGRASLPPREGRASDLAYEPDRREYLAFKEAWPDLIEPNYLPFMVHRFEGDAARGDVLVFCRWPDEQLPLRIFIEPPEVDPEVQDEFAPVDPEDLVAAVVVALEEWEHQLEGKVHFARVATPEEAQLRIVMHGREAPELAPGKRVLGSTESLARACLAHGWDPDHDRIVTSFEVPSLDLYLADEHGLLSPDMVRRLALHELGHALGMRGHSPSPGDLMYPRFDRALPRAGLSAQDVNSFLSLYSMPAGTQYSEVPVEAPPPKLAPAPPSGPPILALAPWVDARFGFELQLPAGWLRIEEPHGLLATNGPSWDYDASLRVLVWPAASLDDFLRRYQAELLAGTWFRARRPMVVFGRPAVEIEVEDETGSYAQRFRFAELPEGRVMVLICEAPIDYAEAWWPWFDAVIATLEVWSGRDRIGGGEATR